MSAYSPQKHTTLCEYIAFLRKHNYTEDADFYEEDVVMVLKKAGIPDPIMMTTRGAIAALYSIIDAAEEAQAQTKRWDMELVK